jgi:hypothetical protein
MRMIGAQRPARVHAGAPGGADPSDLPVVSCVGDRDRNQYRRSGSTGRTHEGLDSGTHTASMPDARVHDFVQRGWAGSVPQAGVAARGGYGSAERIPVSAKCSIPPNSRGGHREGRT